jgi:hypothetical protein
MFFRLKSADSHLHVISSVEAGVSVSFDPTRGGLLVVNDEDNALTDLDLVFDQYSCDIGRLEGFALTPKPILADAQFAVLLHNPPLAVSVDVIDEACGLYTGVLPIPAFDDAWVFHSRVRMTSRYRTVDAPAVDPAAADCHWPDVDVVPTDPRHTGTLLRALQCIVFGSHAESALRAEGIIRALPQYSSITDLIKDNINDQHFITRSLSALMAQGPTDWDDACDVNDALASVATVL